MKPGRATAHVSSSDVLPVACPFMDLTRAMVADLGRGYPDSWRGFDCAQYQGGMSACLHHVANSCANAALGWRQRLWPRDANSRWTNADALTQKICGVCMSHARAKEAEPSRMCSHRLMHAYLRGVWRARV